MPHKTKGSPEEKVLLIQKYLNNGYIYIDDFEKFFDNAPQDKLIPWLENN